MDHASFDRIARLLGGATTRRAGLGAALGGLLGIAAIDPADARNGGKGRGDGDGPGKNRGRGRDRGKPTIEGPCGNGSRKDNICTKDSQCCTGICNTKLGKKNKDKKGRCRCVRRGKPCTADRNCCNGLACASGICGGGGNALIPTGDPCTVSGTACADAKASCTTFDENSGGPAGTYCLLPFLEKTCAKDGDCTVNSCYGGVCLTCACGGCPADDACDSPTVTSGGSIQTAIDNAANDSTITIGPGTYVEDLTISGKSLTFLGCPDGTNEVILKNATQGNRTIDITDGSNFSIGDIVIQGDNDIANQVSGGGIKTSGGNVCVRMRTRFEGCAKFGAKGGGLNAGTAGNPSGYTVIISDAVVFDGNVTDTYGGGANFDTYANTTIDGYVKFINNTADAGGAIERNYDGPLTITGNVQITDNTGNSKAGGIHVYHRRNMPSGTITMTVGGNALIARNTSTEGGGGIVIEYGDETEGVIIEGNAVISDNTTDSYGGGIMSVDSNLTIRGNAKITGNKVSGTSNADGGGIYFKASNSSLIMIEETVEISGNTADLDGGGVWFSQGMLTISGNAVISGNSAGEEGGGVFVDTYSPLTLTISEAAAITGNTSNTANTLTTPSGGGIYVNSSNYTTGSITGCGAVSGNSPDEIANSAGLITTC